MAYTGGVCTISIYFMTSVSSESSLSKEIITLYDLYTNNSIKKRNKYIGMHVLGEATVSEWIWVCMFLGEATVSEWIWVLSNKIITVTDSCAVRVNTFCWCDTV